MRHSIYLILICLSVFGGLNAQAKRPGNYCYEVYHAYELSMYLDNLIYNTDRETRKLTSDIFDSLYYTQTEMSNSKADMIIDITNKTRAFHMRTKKAKDGYLYVNRCITDKVLSSGCQQDTVKITYVYNNQEVTTKEDVRRVLRLRKKKIRIQDLILDERKGLVTVYIVDNK